MEGPSLAARAGAEMLGSLLTCCLALGAVANALLPRTKGEGVGLLAIALAVGLAVGLPIACFWQARLRDALLPASAPWGSPPPCLVGVCGAWRGEAGPAADLPLH